MIHFYSLGVQRRGRVFACRSSELGSISGWAGKIFSLYDKGLIHMCLTHISRIYFPTIINCTCPFMFEGL